MKKINLVIAILSLLVLTNLTTAQNPQGLKIPKPTAHCFCTASRDLGTNPSNINPGFIDWGAIKAYSELFPQKEANQQNCQDVCRQTAAGDSRFTPEWWCANVIAEEQKPYTGKMIAYSKVGTHNYRIALQRDVSCPKGQNPTSTPTAGFVAVDNTLKEKCQRYNQLDVQAKNSNPLISPRMNQVISAIGWNVAGYYATAPNMVFLEGFKLRSCKVCYAEMVITVKALQKASSETASDAGNDAINILGIPNGTAPNYGFSPGLQGFRIWQPPAPAPNNPVSAGTQKTITFQIPANKLNDYIFNTNVGTPLDVLVQDDTAVHAVALRVWYY